MTTVNAVGNRAAVTEAIGDFAQPELPSSVGNSVPLDAWVGVDTNLGNPAQVQGGGRWPKTFSTGVEVTQEVGSEATGTEIISEEERDKRIVVKRQRALITMLKDEASQDIDGAKDVVEALKGLVGTSDPSQVIAAEGLLGKMQSEYDNQMLPLLVDLDKNSDIEKLESLYDQVQAVRLNIGVIRSQIKMMQVKATVKQSKERSDLLKDKLEKMNLPQ